jgi:hypothetical protein
VCPIANSPDDISYVEPATGTCVLADRSNFAVEHASDGRTTPVD